MSIQFFCPMIPPTTTAQERRWFVRKNGKIGTAKTPAIIEAEQKLRASLAKHVPPVPATGPTRIVVKWIWPLCQRHPKQGYKITKPDTDNLQKLLLDTMTDLGFWKDDALVCSQVIEKFYSDPPGVFIRIRNLEADPDPS